MMVIDMNTESSKPLAVKILESEGYESSLGLRGNPCLKYAYDLWGSPMPPPVYIILTP